MVQPEQPKRGQKVSMFVWPLPGVHGVLVWVHGVLVWVHGVLVWVHGVLVWYD